MDRARPRINANNVFMYLFIAIHRPKYFFFLIVQLFLQNSVHVSKNDVLEKKKKLMSSFLSRFSFSCDQFLYSYQYLDIMWKEQ